MKRRASWRVAAVVACLSCGALFASARADVVTDWNEKTAQWLAALPAPVATRGMAIVQVAVHDAVSAISRGGPPITARLDPAPGASVDAAVIAATHAVVLKLAPGQRTGVETAYLTALASIPETAAKSAGVSVGEQAAQRVLDARAGDGSATPDLYRPATSAGVYVPTVLPAVPHWGRRTPWTMSAGDQFRPGPPPALTSDTWARDFNEIKALGGKNSKERSQAQTEMAQFWEATGPIVYAPIARSVALAGSRDVASNARLLAVASVAMDDALIAVFDAKYAYGFWRPVTAIRNGDIDGNDATERDASWTPFIETPMHPEYPCAHCIVAAALGAVLTAEIGNGPTPKLSSTSPTAPGAPRSWERVDDFVTEVSQARICDGVHYRNSTDVARAMGKAIGEQAAKKLLVAPG